MEVMHISGDVITFFLRVYYFHMVIKLQTLCVCMHRCVYVCVQGMNVSERKRERERNPFC